jgi:hypothetical protein
MKKKNDLPQDNRSRMLPGPDAQPTGGQLQENELN